MSEAYRRAGVNIAAGNEAVARIKEMVRETFRPEVKTDIGAFGALFRLDSSRYRRPVLVSGADGVGTKLKIAFALENHRTVGIDLVAMSVNDVAAMGAEPLFFLDYIACSRLEPERVAEVVEGIVGGCKQAGCALIGGETAEMPGMYAPGEYDLAGFCVGIVDEDAVIDGSKIQAGDILLGLPSSGLHSNGFSLVRKVLQADEPAALDEFEPSLGKTLGEELLTPTRIYVSALRRLIGEEDIHLHGIAHITGGGLIENVGRILPEGLQARIDPGNWPIPPIFELIQERGGISAEELFGVLNMGIGLVLVVPNEEVEAAMQLLADAGEPVYQIGSVEEGKGGVIFRKGEAR